MSVARRLFAAVVAASCLAACAGKTAVTKAPDDTVARARDALAQLARNHGALSEEGAAIPIGVHDATRGSRGAFVTIVVFSDFECPYCAKVVPTLERLRETYGPDDLRFVFKHQPLARHRHARLAAETAQGVLALAGQEAFWRFHDMVFARQNLMSVDSIRAWAVAAGADGRAIDQGLENARWAEKIDKDLALGDRIGANAAPTTFVNGVAISGALPFERFKEVVDEELQKAKALHERGVPREALHAELAFANLKGTEQREAAEAEREEAERGERERVESLVVHKMPIGKSPVRGPNTALVTIVEFSDFQCSYCKRAQETLARVKAEYGDRVRVVWKDKPLGSHERAEPAAELARAARAQKGDAGFWTVHDLLFVSQSSLEDEDLERVAGAAKLDVKKAMAQVRSKAFKGPIEDDVDLADDFRVGSTPHFFINGRRLVGAKAFERFSAVIGEEIAKAEGLVRAGTPKTAVYDALVKDGKTAPDPEKRTIAPAPSAAPFRGAAGAKVVVQQVSDFACPFCARADKTIDELVKAYPGKVKIVWRDRPLSSHADAPLAAEAAREAFAQKGNEGFARMQKLLFENQRRLSRQDLEEYAQKIGLDVAKFKSALDARTHKAAIDADEKATTEAGVSATPAFFVGPYFVSGAAPYAKLRRLVDRVLAEPAQAAAASARKGE